MSRAPILINDLVKGNQVWKMLIRVVDLWVVNEKNGNQHLEMVIQDVKDDKIHVTSWNRDFKDWFEQVKEHETYIMYNGEPVDNEGPLKVCSHPLKLVLNGGTTMMKAALPDIPTHNYILLILLGHMSMNEIVSNVGLLASYFLDVIGVLQDVVKTQMGGGNRKSCVNITLRDVEGNVIEVALWEAYGKQFMNYTTPNNTSGPTVIVLTHAWCKPNSDSLPYKSLSCIIVSGLPSLSNAWNGSRLLINFDHPQVADFKASFGTTDLTGIPDLSQSLTCDSSIQSANKFWTNLSEVRSIHAIAAPGKDSYATTIGTTVGFKASKNGWYFESCAGSSGNTDAEPVIKFKVEVEVVYGDHNGTFVFWDKDCIPYTKMTARELREVMKEAGEDNPKIWPAHLDALLNKEFVFRVKYQQQYRQFSIVKILNEEGLYAKFDKYLTPDETMPQQNTLETSTTAPILIPNQLTQTSEQSICAEPYSAANPNSSPEASSNSTPAKRGSESTSVNDTIQAEEITPKQSATKAKTGRKLKHLKKE
ncbi:uncharacterized protein LOC131623070 [Vicia villosa]|uniref:uncharacterized protein LOC131623070 n=1 Tax=Vicia villosa TaxID=3911 RepID=UPI00273C7D9A|nr:uncharacterized protein LOC131623070 [Vicia villosa]